MTTRPRRSPISALFRAFASSRETLLLLLASFLFPLSHARAAEIYGQFRNANTTPYTNEVLFRALSTPLNASPRIITGGDFRVTPSTNGDFTITLQAGNYRVFTKFDQRGFVIDVPDATNSYLINSRITTALTYTPAAIIGGAATNVPLASAGTAGILKTDTSAVDPVVYLRSTVDTLLAGKVAMVDGTASNLVIRGDASVGADSILELQYSMTGAGPETAARKDYVDDRTIAIVSNLAALLAIPSPPNERLAIVLGDTVTGDTSDGATGEWMFFPTSTATASPVVKIPNDRSPVTLGRWIKRL